VEKTQRRMMRGRRRRAHLAPGTIWLVLLISVAAPWPARAQRPFWNPFVASGVGGGVGGGRWRGGNGRGGGETTVAATATPDFDDDRGSSSSSSSSAVPASFPASGSSGNNVVVVRPDGSSYQAGIAGPEDWARPPPLQQLPPPPPPLLAAPAPTPAPEPAPAPPLSSPASSPSPSPRPSPSPSPPRARSEAEALLQAASQPVGTTFLSASSLAGGTTAAAQTGAGTAGDALALAVDASSPLPPGAELVGFLPTGAPSGSGTDTGPGTRGAPTSLTVSPPSGGGGGGGPLVVPSSCSDLWDCVQRSPSLQLLRRWVEVAQFQDALPKCGGPGGGTVTQAGRPLPGGATLFAVADAWYQGYNCAGMDFTPLFPLPFGTEADAKVFAARNFVLGGLIPNTRVSFSWAERDRARTAKTYAGYSVSYKFSSSGDKLVEWTTGLGVRFQARVLGSVVPSGCAGKVALHVVSKPVAPPSSFETQMASGGDALGSGAAPDASRLASLSQAVAAEPSTRLYFGQLAGTGQLDSLPKCVAGGRVAFNGRVSQGATIFVARDAWFFGVSCLALNFAPLTKLFRENPSARAFAQANFVVSGIVADQALRPSAFTGSPRRASTAGGGQLAVFKDPSTGALKVSWDTARAGAVREARVLRTLIPGGCPTTVMHVTDVAVAPKASLVGKKRRRRRRRVA
jgi:hypothetical protein